MDPVLPSAGLLPFDPSAWTLFSWGGRLLGVLVLPSVLLQRSTRPMATLVWILSLLFIPYVGVIAWWLVGRDTIKRRRRRHYRARQTVATRIGALDQSVLDIPPEDHPAQADPISARDESRFARVTRNEFHLFSATGPRNRIAIYATSKEAFDAFEHAIQEAREHIHFQFYIWKADKVGTRFRDLLVQKAHQGLQVRVLYDAVGGAHITKEFTRPLVEAGAKVASFLPLRIWERRLRVNFRNHRKILVIDGKVGFTGGVNIADEYLDWLDMAFGFHGPVVQQMQEVFAEDWFFATRSDLAEGCYFPASDSASATLLRADPLYDSLLAQFVASGPDDPLQTIHKMFFYALITARESIDIITPYFVPDSAIFTALQTAAMQGVHIRIILPANADIVLTHYAGRSFWEDLLEVGIEIYQFQEQMLHAKLLLLDQSHSIVGSANMDVRSFRLNFEASSVVEGQAVNQALRKIFEKTLDRSIEVQLHEFRQRSRKERLFEGGARLFSPLL